MPAATHRLRSFAIGLLMLCGCATGMTQPARAQEGRVVALGASFTAGRWVANSAIFTTRLGEMLRAQGYRVRVVNEGVNGDSTRDMLNRLSRAVPGDTTIVIMEYARGNDEKEGLSVDDTIENVKTIVDRLLARRVRMLLVVRGRDPGQLQTRVGWFQEFAAQRHVPVLPIEQPPSTLIDGRHPNAEAHAAIAAIMLGPVEALLKESAAGR